ncbi:bifunctional adenosylcobinamide kinase/adenosylcobinamide-phosphate guanylyltransferase [Microbaculum marinum]|uniref:Bifunctional adenosylcobalamin biosynthesis protein n=1 Tax=Microbaculum marinum TaxID=1764581 RepID=A0AAW9RF67_9HYPH
MTLTLVVGGARSGKSRHAESLIRGHPGPWTYVATAEARDAEMRERIARHRQQRGEGWVTVEAPVALPATVREAPAAPMLVDCLTLWLSNLMLGGRDVAGAAEDLEAALSWRAGPTVVVTNEVGQGIVPETTLGRAFRDEQGRLNQQIAARAATVILMVAGLPMTVKDVK